MPDTARSAQEKALQINLDARKYGIFAEIGAGQEVVRWFFHVGKSSATVAESISAYDMAISDSLYGPTDHYVSRARLNAMLDREYGKLMRRLSVARGAKAAFFVFADTVATRASARARAGHGWLGVRFQHEAGAEPSEVIIHIEMLDTQAAGQQEAVGLMGVNLLYGAFYHAGDPNRLVGSLMDGLNRRRVEVDMIKFAGPAFPGVDNRLMSLQLVEQELADTAMFTAAGDVVQPSEVLYNRHVLIERGSFRPVTNVALNMLDRALDQLQGRAESPSDPVVLMEMTLHNLKSGQSIDHDDFLARADTLGALNKTVMITSYTRFDNVIGYLRHYTRDWIGLVVGLPTLREIFDEKYYVELESGILEGLGKLFRGQVRLFVYPTVDAASGELLTADKLDVDDRLRHLYAYLFDNGFIEPIRDFDPEQLHITPPEVLRKLQSGDAAWKDLVPAAIVPLIEQRGLFGSRPAAKT